VYRRWCPRRSGLLVPRGAQQAAERHVLSGDICGSDAGEHGRGYQKIRNGDSGELRHGLNKTKGGHHEFVLYPQTSILLYILKLVDISRRILLLA